MERLIIISAQPDTPFYEWQLEIQFLNLTDLGYNLSNYHVLISYPDKPSSRILKLTKRYPEVNWGLYQDTRKDTTSYVSSLRPHVLKKHFLKNPWLAKERIFYIDSDVIFRTIPAFHKLSDPNTWYFSKTDYISVEKIKEKGAHILYDMCKIIDVDPSLVENSPNNGGAQMWINDVNADFWENLEIKATRIHDYLKISGTISAKIWSKKNALPIEDYKPLDPYMADMWATLWMGIAKGKKIQIDPILDFCIPQNPLSKWKECTMLHYSLMNNCPEPEYFHKRVFIKGIDFEWTSKDVNKTVCGIKYVEYLEKVVEARKKYSNQLCIDNI